MKMSVLCSTEKWTLQQTLQSAATPRRPKSGQEACCGLLMEGGKPRWGLVGASGAVKARVVEPCWFCWCQSWWRAAMEPREAWRPWPPMRFWANALSSKWVCLYFLEALSPSDLWEMPFMGTCMCHEILYIIACFIVLSFNLFIEKLLCGTFVKPMLYK